MNRNSSSMEDSSLQQVNNESSCEYVYDSDYQEEEEEASAPEDKDAVMAQSARNQVEIFVLNRNEVGLQPSPPPPISYILRRRSSCSMSGQEQESDVSSMASSSFVPVDPPVSYVLRRRSSCSVPRQESGGSSMSLSSFVPVDAPSDTNISAGGANQQIQNANSMAMTSSWSHIAHTSVSAGVQSMASTMMNTVMTSKSVISAFELVAAADGSICARCKACGFMNKKHEKVGLCRGCSAVLVNNPCLEMDEVLAMTLQRKEAKDGLVHRKMIASYQTLLFVRAQAMAVEVTSTVLRRRNSTLDINQPECFACHPMKELDLTFHASNFIERLEFLRSDGRGFRLALGYAFSLKTDVVEIHRDGLPESNRRLIVSTDPEVALRLKNGLTPVPTNEDDATDEQDKKGAPPPLGQYNEGACVGWIVAVVSSLEDYSDWSTVEHENDEQENPQKIEILNTMPSNSCQCLPMAYFDAKHRKDARIASLLHGLSDICLDFFHTDWSLITIDEEEDDDECERGQGNNANKKSGATPSGSTATRTSGESSCKVDSLDEKDSEALNRMTALKTANATAG